MKKHTSRNGKEDNALRSYSKYRSKWRHVLFIDQRIRSGTAPNCQRLAAELEVSTKTVWRDIDFLREIGAPVEYDAQQRGYVYTQRNWTMPDIHITEGELFAFVVAENALKSYAGSSWYVRLKQICDRIRLTLPERIVIQPEELVPRFSFDSQGAAIIDPDIMEKISQAIQQNHTVKINYKTLGYGETRTYMIDPYALRHTRGGWYLAGRDHRNQQIPLFNLSRIRSLTVTDETFDYDAEEFDPKAYFDDTFGAFHTNKKYVVSVEFDGTAAQLVQERQWHDSQRLTKGKNGKVRFTVTVSHFYDIVPWILSWGDEVKVVSPKELLRLVAEKTRNMSNLYAGE